MLQWLIGIILGEIICKSSSFNLSAQDIRFYWCVKRIQKFLLPFWWYNRGSYPLENKDFGGVTTSNEHPQRFRRTNDYWDGNFVPAREGSIRPGGRLPEPLFFPNFCYPEALRWPSGNPQFETNKFVHSSTAFQDEESPCHSSSINSRRLSSHHQSAGCLSSCTHASRFPPSVGFSVSKSNFSFPGIPFYFLQKLRH